MTKIKKLVITGAVIGALTISATTAFAAVPRMPIEDKAAVLEQRVEDGTMTQEKADEIIAAIEKNQETCDGTGSAQIGKENGAAFGGGQGKGQGRGQGQGGGRGQGGQGRGQGGGQGLRDGSCVAQ